MDLPKIKELIELVQETKIAEIEIREGETVVHIKNSSSTTRDDLCAKSCCITAAFYHLCRKHARTSR